MINQTIAHYKITSKLGQGGMGLCGTEPQLDFIPKKTGDINEN